MPIRRTSPFEDDLCAAAPVDPDEAERARRTIAARALDEADARHLLAVLGLVEAPRTTWKHA